MPILPDNVTYGTVTGRFLVDAPEDVPATGMVRFVPSPKRLRNMSSTPATVIVLEPVLCDLDVDGYLIDDAGNRSVTLVATDNADIAPLNWTWQVQISVAGDRVARVDMALPGGTTVDLATVIPVTPDDGVAPTVVVGATGPTGPQGPIGDPGGPAGPPGVGIPVGGSAGEVLAKTSSTDYATTWVAASAPGAHAATHAAGSSDPVTITQAQVTGLTASLAAKASTATFTSSTDGLSPSSGGGATNFLRADGTWAAPPGGTGTGVTDGDKGDIVVSGTGATWLFDTTVVTAAAKTVLDDSTTAAMLTTLGAQPVDADLTTIAGLTPTTDNIVQSVGSAWASRTPAQVKTALALDQVTNTTDANKPVSTAQATAIGAKADKTTTISTTAPLAGGGDLSTNRTLTVSAFTTSTPGVVPLSGGGTNNFLRADATWAMPPSIYMNPSPPPVSNVLWADTDETGTGGGAGAAFTTWSYEGSPGKSVAAGATYELEWDDTAVGTMNALPTGWYLSDYGATTRSLYVNFPAGIYSFFFMWISDDYRWNPYMTVDYIHGITAIGYTAYLTTPAQPTPISGGGTYYITNSMTLAVNGNYPSVSDGKMYVTFQRPSSAPGAATILCTVNVVRLGDLPT
jgi:hypothetical protein